MTEPTPILCRPIGFVRSRFTQPQGVPVQGAAAPDEQARVELLPAYAEGLRDIEGFDHLILLTHFHRCASEPLTVTPFLDTGTHGVFATRSPAQPNRIGLSIVQLLQVRGCVLHFAGNDLVDGTPVLDIKPYVPRFDVRASTRIGWFAGRLDDLAKCRADDRHPATPEAPETPASL